MGHLIFLVMHFVALLFLPVALFLTIPLHLIYSATGHKKPDPNAPTERTHVRCPQCREFVRRDASICKSCRIELVPQEQEGFFKGLFARRLD